MVWTYIDFIVLIIIVLFMIPALIGLLIDPDDNFHQFQLSYLFMNLLYTCFILGIMLFIDDELYVTLLNIGLSISLLIGTLYAIHLLEKETVG